MYHHGMVASLPVMTLTPRPPFDAGPILGYLSRSPLEPLDVVADSTYRRAVVLAGRPTLIEVTPGGTPDEPHLAVRVLATGAPTGAARDAEPLDDNATLALAAETVARWWRIEQDPAELDLIAARDPVMGALLTRLRGARAPLMPSPFECLVWAILGQQITVAFAYKMKRALVERYGTSLTHEGRTYWLFPDAARLAEADPADLREIQFSRQKSEYVRGLAALVAEDRIPWSDLATAPSGEAIRALTALRGVGRWTAEYVLMRGLGHTDVIPAADVGLQLAIGRAYGLGRKATEPEVRALAENWAPRRSHAAYAWWWSLSAEDLTAQPAARREYRLRRHQLPRREGEQRSPSPPGEGLG
jgi:DNA-3-methyladenine glycosylase II